MAKIPNRGRLIDRHRVGDAGAILEFEMLAPTALGFTGGKYVIVNTGLPAGEGKFVKRAYSIISSDTEQGRFKLGIQRLGDNVGSNRMLSVDLGTEMFFSGPWGKWLAPEQADQNNADPGRTSYVVATDTGITAALGLLQGASFRERLGDCHLLWTRPDAAAFLTEGFVRELLPGLGGFEASILAEAGTPARLTEARALAENVADTREPGDIYMVGDGAALAEMRTVLTARGWPVPQMFFEAFFNRKVLFPS